ncbi:MAG: TolC family protein, partial [Pseudomonadota bacterium]
MGTRSPFILSMSAVGLVLGGCTFTPVPLDEIELASEAESNLANVVVEQEPINGSIGLYDAMARALKYNLDSQVEVYQTALRHREFDLSHYSMLPRLVANSELSRRDNFSASTSRQVVNGDLGPAGAFSTFNTSQERNRRTNDIELSWHVLDFGLSYVRARQAGDKALIADEARRKVVNRIIEDVRTAFWRAVTAERLVHRLRRLERRTRVALANTRSLAAEEQTSPVTALTYERELVEIKRTIQELQRDLSVAKTQLAALMNVKPGTRFHLKYPRLNGRHLRIGGKVRDMVWTAMNNRAE